MTSLVPKSESTDIFYPSSDGEPLAETSVHADAIINTVVALRQYLAGKPAIVLADQFLYYAQGYPRLRVAPDVMVIYNVPPGARDNYKIWEERQVPLVIFEMTSQGTREQDISFKKTLYEQLAVLEYWLFDPKGEWIPEQLRGYRLIRQEYELITDKRSEALQLRLEIEEQLIAFYKQDTKEKLLAPGELVQALQQEILAREQAEERTKQAEERAKQAELQVERLKEQLRRREAACR
ncbi:Uma2 family endonuclease [Plectonema radiosum NIES-515]|uniref:Uma2 family endonuclease n=1 Tax=Plectonema radiosum NIES-515 TaxID=2986073 RepID=A0ABT3B3M8_9CYAN|nr:Uma2 family endonuclease [Plectonema radiosum]MCV3215845.1 Uma2 family endonuclease [Plectonema radiosum NIES-515]